MSDTTTSDTPRTDVSAESVYIDECCNNGMLTQNNKGPYCWAKDGRKMEHEIIGLKLVLHDANVTAARAEAERDALLADKRRLDWLEKESPLALWRGFKNTGEPLFEVSRMDEDGQDVTGPDAKGADIRAAIDAAMKEQAP